MEFSPNVTQLTFNEQKFFIIGTAHLSRSSVNEVKNIISEVKPDSVCIELCSSRYESIKNISKWKQMDIFKVIKEKN